MSEGSVSAEQLMGFVEEIESLNDESVAINEQKRAVRKAAELAGVDLKALKRVIERRREDPEAVVEGDALLESYEQLIGSGAAAVGVLSTTRGVDGRFEVKIVQAQAPAPRSGRVAKARESAIALAELAQRAREQ